jgi:hypothetical protein
MARAVLFDRHPFEHTVRWRTIANVLSMGFVVTVKLRSLHSGHQSSRGSADLARIVESFAESSIKLASLVLPANSLPRQKLREIVDAAAAAGLRVIRLSSTCDLQQKADDAFAFELIEVAICSAGSLSICGSSRSTLSSEAGRSWSPAAAAALAPNFGATSSDAVRSNSSL